MPVAADRKGDAAARAYCRGEPEPGQPDPKPGHHILPKDTMSHPERGGAPPGAPQVPWKGARCGAGSARGTAAARRTQPNQGHRSLQMDTNARSERGERRRRSGASLGVCSAENHCLGVEMGRLLGLGEPRDCLKTVNLAIRHGKTLFSKSPTMCWSGSWPFWSLWASLQCHCAT